MTVNKLTVKIIDVKGYVKETLNFECSARELVFSLLDYVDMYPPCDYTYRIIEE